MATMTVTPITNSAGLPSDGMIVVKPRDSNRSRGWHIEKVTCDRGDSATVMATPVNIGTGRTNGRTQVVHLRFEADQVTPLPGAVRP